MSRFLDETAAFPYCPGCGHSHVLRALDEALEACGVPPERIVLVTDIGCVGLADRLFPRLHTVHALHGRAVALATGMQLMERRRDGAPPLKPVVLVGDGGATIGLLHLVHAAQLDTDVTVLVHNNLVYGMTGGQHSGLTPEGLRTATTPAGNPAPPIDLGRVLEGAGAGHFARSRVPSRSLPSLIAAAIARPAFACVELLELCPTFAARKGGVTGKDLARLAAERGGEGLLLDRPPRPSAVPPPSAARGPLDAPLPVEAGWSRLRRTVRVTVAGRAGEGVQSAAHLAATAAASAGLAVAVRTDNPVTQGTGFSLAEIGLGPDRLEATVPGAPELLVVTAEEGVRALAARGLLEPGASAPRVVADAALALPEGVAADARPLARRFGRKGAALGALVEESRRGDWFAPEAWRAALARLPEARRRAIGAAVDAALAG